MIEEIYLAYVDPDGNRGSAYRVTIPAIFSHDRSLAEAYAKGYIEHATGYRPETLKVVDN